MRCSWSLVVAAGDLLNVDSSSYDDDDDDVHAYEIMKHLHGPPPPPRRPFGAAAASDHRVAITGNRAVTGIG